MFFLFFALFHEHFHLFTGDGKDDLVFRTAGAAHFTGIREGNIEFPLVAAAEERIDAGILLVEGGLDQFAVSPFGACDQVSDLRDISTVGQNDIRDKGSGL